MVVALHLLVLAFCAAECASALRDIRGRLIKLMMFGGLGLIHGLVPALTRVETLPMLFGALSDASRVEAALLALIGVVLFSAGWRLYEGSRFSWEGLNPGLQSVIDSPEGQQLLRRLFWACAAVAVIAWVASFLSTGVSFAEYLRSTRFTYRLTGNIYLRTFASHALALACVPGFICFFLPRRYRLIALPCTFAAAVFLFYAYKGSRAPALGLLGAPMMGYALRYRIGARRFVTLGAATAAIVFLSIALKPIRWVMTNASAKEVARMVFSPETYQDALVKDPLYYHQFLVAAVELFPDRHPYVNGATYVRLLVFYLPRAYFPIKPVDTNQVFSAVVIPGTSSTEAAMIPPTMMGDGYINFWGLPGIAIMLVNGIAFGFISTRVRMNLLWLVAVGAQFVRFALIGIRGQPYQLFVGILSAVILVWLIGRLCGFSFRNTKIVAERAAATLARSPGA